MEKPYLSSSNPDMSQTVLHIGHEDDKTINCKTCALLGKDQLDAVLPPSYGQTNETEYSYIEAVEGYYKIHTTSKNWLDAKQVCEQEGATLFYPENSDEADALTSFWRQSQNDSWFLVGISDIKTEGVYETIDGKSISEVYNEWMQNQPDNSDNEDCVHLYKNGNINDIKCDSQYGFICKKSLIVTEQNFDSNIPESTLNEKNDTKFFRKDYSYVESSQGFYKIHTIPKTFADAKRECALEGARLFYPENTDEAQAVTSFWNRTQPTILWVYAGISAPIAKGVFETIDYKPVSEVYNNWMAGEPNDRLGIEDCVYLTKEGMYYDGPCDKNNQFICKKSLQSLEWNYSCNMSDLGYVFNKNFGKCYKFHTTPLNWTEAYAVCSAEESYLAVITDRLEADYLVNLTESAPELRIKGNYQRGIYHVGFHNRFNEGWQTVKGTPLNVTEIWWGNYYPEADDRQQCGSMFFDGCLTHINCDMRSFFICEHEGGSATSVQEENYLV